MGPRLRGDTRLCCPTLVEYPYASFASSQSCRTASITRNCLPSSMCQKVQPLQLGAPCTPAPTLWIEPAGWPSHSRLPSTRTTARQRRFASVRRDPGAIIPHSTSVPKAKIGRAHVCTTVTTAHLVCRLLLE